MSHPEQGRAPEKDEGSFDSLNMEIVEPTDITIDNTVRPMRDSLRKWLKLPPYDKRPPSGQIPPRPDEPAA